MNVRVQTRRVEIGFVSAPPARRIALASGVANVEVDGLVLHCIVCGSFQPLLEALRGHEVVTLTSTPTEEEPGVKKDGR